MAASRIGASLGALSSNQSSSQLVRTSTGNLYAILAVSANAINGSIGVFKSTDNGISWARQDYIHSPQFPANNTVVSAAIDSTDKIHILYNGLGPKTSYLPYITSTDLFGVNEVLNGTASSSCAGSIAIDSNNMPHIVRPNSGAALQYSNRVGGFWRPFVTVLSGLAAEQSVELQIDNKNLPQVSYSDATDGLGAAVGNKNNASSFTNQILETTAFSLAGGTSIAIDSSNNTWLAYQGQNDTRVLLKKHISTDAWSTWQTSITDNFGGKSVSLAADQADIYVFYERNAGGIAYDRYDTINGKWFGETILQPATSTMTTNFRPHNPFVKWSQYFNNGDTGANNQGQDTIEYLFDDGSTVYYDKLVTAQLSEGFVNFSFPPGGTTSTSTSSTSSSTSSTSSSVSTSSTSSSISTSSTSSSTSSTSSSVSTSSTSSSISTSSTSSSTSSTSSSISTSSTSSSISTSSTSSSTSSTSSSISTSSTSSSISTSSTSSSLSTSSTSSSTSSTSSSISTSSTSSSISTSSTSSSTSSTSSSISTSSTSSSISTSSTSSSTSSTSSSISTSSTSSSISTSSTSSSTSSTSSSISTSSTSSSTSSTSSSISTSSTSSSVSTSSTSSSISTSSTSSSTSSTSSSISTSSTSSSFSTSSTSSSLSTSSTSSSLSTSSTSSSISTSSTSSSFSTSSTSSSTSTSSTSSSSSTSSTSTSLTVTTTSTSSTSVSTSTSTTMIDATMIPYLNIRNNFVRMRVRTP